MKAAVYGGPYDLSIKEFPTPMPARGEVLIKTKAVGICGSDLEIYQGKFKQTVPPLIIGHEGGGIIHAVGEGVTSVKAGDRVVVECILHCGRCEFCRRGAFGLCDDGGVMGMIGRHGEYAEYFVAPEVNCHHLPEEISWPEAGLIDTLAGPVYAAAKLSFPFQSTVAVFGAGPAGLFFCSLAKLYGASRVYLVGTRAERLAYGPSYGTDLTISVNAEDAVRRIKEDTGGRGVDIAIEAAGSGKALDDCLRALRKGGQLLIYGVFGGGPVPVDVQLAQIYEYTVIGAATVEYPPAIALIRQGLIKVKDLVTHTLTLDELPEAFANGLIEKRLGGYMKGVVFF